MNNKTPRYKAVLNLQVGANINTLCSDGSLTVIDTTSHDHVSLSFMIIDKETEIDNEYLSVLEIEGSSDSFFINTSDETELLLAQTLTDAAINILHAAMKNICDNRSLINSHHYRFDEFEVTYSQKDPRTLSEQALARNRACVFFSEEHAEVSILTNTRSNIVIDLKDTMGVCKAPPILP